MAEATFYHGNVLTVDHTPGSAVTGGDVILAGTVPFIAHLDIAANVKGAVAAGGGVYKVTVDGAMGGGVEIFWNNTTKKVTTTASGNAHFGYTTPDTSASADGDSIYAIHQPKGVQAA